MARAKAEAPASVLAADVEDMTPLERDDLDVEQQIAAEFNAAPEDTRWLVSVSRAASGNEKEKVLFRCTPADLPVFDRLRDDYGSGDYIIKVYQNGRISSRYAMSIEAPVHVEPRASEPNALASTLTAAMEQQTRLLEGFINRAVQPQPSPASSLLSKIDVVQLITAAPAALAAIKTLFAPQPSLDPEKIMNLVLKGMDIANTAQENAGGGSKSTSVMDLIRDALKSGILEKFAEAAQNAQRMPPGAVIVPAGPITPMPLPQQPAPQPANTQAPIPSVPEQQHVEPPQPAADPTTAIWLHHVHYLITRAATGSDTELYADWIIDNIPQEMLSAIVAEPNFIEILVQTVPETAPYKIWFGKLFGHVKDILAEPAEGDGGEMLARR